MSTHQEKQRIFDDYAKSKNFTDWKALQQVYKSNLINKDELMLHVFSACDLVQEEQQKRIAENAKTKTVFTAYGPQHAVEKNSIINPENLIS